ncbi:unnamed protein product [Phaedon cochleariae]|uniref:SAM domain-containing protein n=1 Tax=Phaedon cochleariae TaxID=80249 RepID=A0A9N9X471_PHACE|nr:unnamed protein product [Phaedon cochleariae]
MDSNTREDFPSDVESAMDFNVRFGSAICNLDALDRHDRGLDPIDVDISDAASDLAGYLRSWDLSQYIDIFRRNDITLGSLPFLKDDMIKELIPSIGHRAIFLSHWEKWKISMVSAASPSPPISQSGEYSPAQYNQEPSNNAEASAEASAEAQKDVQSTSSYIVGSHRSANSSPSTSRGQSPLASSRRFSCPGLLQEDVEEQMQWLKNSTDPWATVEVYWEITRSARMHILSKEDMTINEYFSMLPCLQKPAGYLLLMNDYDHLHGNVTGSLVANFPLHKERLLEVMKNKANTTTVPSLKLALQELLTVAESGEEQMNLALFMALTYLLNLNCKQKGKKVDAWRPSRLEAAESFITYVRSAAEIKETVKRRREKMAVAKDSLKTLCFEDESVLRTFDEYNEQVNNGLPLTTTGIKEKCVWLGVQGFSLFEQELPNGPTTTTTTVEVQIHSVVLKVKHVFPNDEIELQLMQPIKNDTPILIPFRKWDLSQLPALTNGAKSEIWAVKTSASVERPRYVIVCFQKSKRDNAEADATHFDNTSIASIRLALNGEYWPNERMQLDFAKQDYTLAYYNYTRFYSSYSHSTEVHPILDYGEFKQHALFVIDCSRQEETMKSSTVDIKLEIEADKGFPADTKAYCIIVHDCLLEYFPLTEVVRTLI